MAILPCSKYELPLNIICTQHKVSYIDSMITVCKGKRNIYVLKCGKTIQKIIRHVPLPSEKGRTSKYKEILIPNEWKMAFLMEGMDKKYYVVVGEISWKDDEIYYQVSKYDQEAKLIKQTCWLNNPTTAVRKIFEKKCNGRMLFGLYYDNVQTLIRNSLNNG